MLSLSFLIYRAGVFLSKNLAFSRQKVYICPRKSGADVENCFEMITKSNVYPKKMLYDMFLNLVDTLKRFYLCAVILKTIFLP